MVCNPGLEEHSSRMSYIPPPKRGKDTGAGFPNLQPSKRRQPRKVIPPLDRTTVNYHQQKRSILFLVFPLIYQYLSVYFALKNCSLFYFLPQLCNSRLTHTFLITSIFFIFGFMPFTLSIEVTCLPFLVLYSICIIQQQFWWNHRLLKPQSCVFI